jgi:hypothetical protein
LLRGGRFDGGQTDVCEADADASWRSVKKTTQTVHKSKGDVVNKLYGTSYTSFELEAFFERQNRPKSSHLYLDYLQNRTVELEAFTAAGDREVRRVDGE